jgi:predicted RNase H-like nuclease
VVPTLDALLESLPQSSLLLIDMPIGLPQSGGEERPCDLAARKLLGKGRASSVFPVPVRPALRASGYEEAKAINRRLSGKGISYQSWNLAPKLRELDELMQHSPRARHCVREAHPEICFWALNGRQAMQYNKKTAKGRREREALLYRYLSALPDILAHAASRYRRAELGWDDMLDAAVLAYSARHGPASLSTLPNNPEHDAHGLPMAIVYYEPRQS